MLLLLLLLLFFFLAILFPLILKIFYIIEHPIYSKEHEHRILKQRQQYEVERKYQRELRMKLQGGMRGEWEYCLTRTLTKAIYNNKLLMEPLTFEPRKQHCFEGHEHSQTFYKCIEGKQGSKSCMYCFGEHAVKQCVVKIPLRQRYMELGKKGIGFEHRGYCVNCLLPYLSEAEEEQHYYPPRKSHLVCTIGSWPVMIIHYLSQLKPGGGAVGFEYAAYERIKQQMKMRYGNEIPMLNIRPDKQGEKEGYQWEHRGGEFSYHSFWVLHYLVFHYWKL